MDETRYFKAECAHCGNHIEFPDTAVGRVVDCPHCGQRTQLRAGRKPEAEAAPPKQEPAPAEAVAEEESSPGGGRLFGLVIAIAGVLIACVVCGAGFLYWKSHREISREVTTAKPKGPATKATANTPPPPANAPQTASVPSTPTRPKAQADLKAGEIQLENAKGSSLVYAVGQLTNDSDYQRFGVTVQLDVFNKGEKKIGTAKDYIAILEPRKSWRFRALITDAKAAGARVASIKEE